MAALKKYPDELRERALRLYRESDPKTVIRQLARQLGVHHEALRNWIRQDEADRGQRDDQPTPTRHHLMALLGLCYSPLKVLCWTLWSPTCRPRTFSSRTSRAAGFGDRPARRSSRA